MTKFTPMSLRSLLLLMALTSVLPVSLRAQRAVPRIDPSVQTVVSGGRWKTERATGSLRVVEIAQGFENARHRVFVQWMEDTEGGARVGMSRDLGQWAPGQFSLTNPRLVYEDGKWRIDVKVASRPTEPPARTLSFLVGLPGQVTPVEPR